MKSIFKSFLVIGLLLVSAVSFAQKTAFINLDSLLTIMPEYGEAKKNLAEHYKQLESTLTTMQKELNDKGTEYQANESKYTDLIKQTKQKEIQDLQQRIQDFQTSAQSEIQKKQEELTKPVLAKAKKSIEKIAKTKGYKMVIDASGGLLLYSEPADDIFNAVKLDLGIK